MCPKKLASWNKQLFSVKNFSIQTYRLSVLSKSIKISELEKKKKKHHCLEINDCMFITFWLKNVSEDFKSSDGSDRSFERNDRSEQLTHSQKLNQLGC